MKELVNKAHAQVSLQISKFGPISDLGDQDFTLSRNYPFLIKNDNGENVTLEVLPQSGLNFVETVFSPGWNPEIVKAIRQTDQGGTLLWGY